MDYQEEFKNPLITIPQHKLNAVIRDILDKYPESRGKPINFATEDCGFIIDAVQRYYEANIPVDYWFRSMDDFKGDKNLLTIYQEITSDMPKAYRGVRYCFAGKHGVGKTYACSSILKCAVEKGYSGLYTTLTDLVAIMASTNGKAKEQTRQLILSVSFLVIDEFDSRFMGSDNASDLYGRILEPAIRTRIQNTLPLFLCTNSPNVVTSFTGPLKESISSLMNLVKTVPVLGSDYRPTVAKEGQK